MRIVSSLFVLVLLIVAGCDTVDTAPHENQRSLVLAGLFPKLVGAGGGTGAEVTDADGIVHELVFTYRILDSRGRVACTMVYSLPPVGIAGYDTAHVGRLEFGPDGILSSSDLLLIPAPGEPGDSIRLFVTATQGEGLGEPPYPHPPHLEWTVR